MNLPQQLISVVGAAIMAATLWAQTGPAELTRIAEQPAQAIATAADLISVDSLRGRLESAMVEQGLTPGQDYFWYTTMGYNRTVEVVVSR